MRSAGAAETYLAGGDVGVSLRAGILGRLADYVELTKPRIALLVLVTVAVGYTLGSAGRWELVPLANALFGIGLVAAGASVLNHLLEAGSDARMQRTAGRPLPVGRLSSSEVLVFGAAGGGLGIVYLAVWVNGLTALLAGLTLFLYAGLYTPLKRRTCLCTAIGAIPGALPPVLGWTAAGGGLTGGAFALFAILFLWQFPHFLAIGWLYRADYARAGLRMLPAGTPRVTGFLCFLYTLALLPVSLLPSQCSLAGDGYTLAAVVLGLGYLACSVRFLLQASARSARGLLLASLLYLPLLLLALTWNHLQLLQ